MFRVYRSGMVIGDSKTGEMDKIDGPYYLHKLEAGAITIICGRDKGMLAEAKKQLTIAVLTLLPIGVPANAPRFFAYVVSKAALGARTTFNVSRCLARTSTSGIDYAALCYFGRRIWSTS